MNKTLTIYRIIGLGILIFIASWLYLPQISEAHSPDHPLSLWPTGYWGGAGGDVPLLSCTGDGSGGQMVCTSLCDLLHTMQHLIYFGITLALFVFTPIFVAYGGILMLIAGANESLWSQGKKVLTGTVIGIALSLGSFLIVNTFLIVFGQNRGPGTIQFGSINCQPGVNAPPAIKVCFGPNPDPNCPRPSSSPGTGN